MIELYGSSWQTLQILHPRFAGGVCSAQLFEDLHTANGIWERNSQRHVWEQTQDQSARYVSQGAGACAPEGAFRMTFEAVPAENDVALTATIENLGDQSWTRLVGEACLGLRPFLWQDFDGKRILMVTADGLKARHDIPTVLSMSRPRYASSGFEGDLNFGQDGVEFLGSKNHWGPDGLTTAPITEGVIIGHDREIGYKGDDSFIGFAWDRVGYLWSNTTNCIHCAALFGDVAPGQSVTRRGKIYIAENADDLLERYRSDFPQRGRCN